LAEAALTWDEPRYREARAAATEALVDLSGPECADAFTTLAIEGPFDLNRCHDIVVRLLERGGQDALRAASAAAINALAAARDDRAARAAEVLVWLGPSSVEPLLGLLEQASAPRATTIRALGRLHDLRAIEPVSEFLGDEDPDARRAAATALGEICDPRTASRLMKATSDPDHRVRDAALEALRKLGPLAAATPPSPHPDEAPLSNGNGSHDVRARSPASPPVMPGSAGWLAG
jgi:HEAT repeat protein